MAISRHIALQTAAVTMLLCFAVCVQGYTDVRHRDADSKRALPQREPPKLYVYAEGNLRNNSFLPVLMNWTTHAHACGYEGMFYADSDFQALHLGPPAADSGCEWCSLGSAQGFLSNAAMWQQHAAVMAENQLRVSPTSARMQHEQC